MPDLPTLLREAADAIVPGPMPPFTLVEQRHRRRRHRRVATVAAAAAATVGVVSLTTLIGQRARTTPLADAPCVTRTSVNSRDTFIAVPRSGVRQLEIEVGSIVTVGWASCDERGDLTLSEIDPKALVLAEPSSGFTVAGKGVNSARYQAFRTGTVTLAGQGSLGTDGALRIAVVPKIVPDGPSAPSPYPGTGIHEGVPPLCREPDAADAQGRVTETVAFGTSVLAPAPDVPSAFTADQILQRFRDGQGNASLEGQARAVFGRLSDANTSPFPKDRALWVVVICGGPPPQGHGGFVPEPTPAPGTSPSPAGSALGLVVAPYDENGRPLGQTYSAYADERLASSMLFEVPFERVDPDAPAGRQVDLRYRSDNACSTFDHLQVAELDGPVYVQVWLRLTSDGRMCSGDSDEHTVTVGLRRPLGDRPLVRGEPDR